MANVLLWFRNDLRLEDNPALERAQAFGCKNAIYLKTPKQWHQHNKSAIQQDFIERHLALLKYQLEHLGIQLSVVEVDDYEQQVNYLVKKCTDENIATIFANSELELNENVRDQKLYNAGVKLALTQSDTILPLGQVTNQQNQMYKVFTPYKKAWLKQIRTYAWPLTNPLPDFELYQETDENRLSKDWTLADAYMKNIWPEFLHEHIHSYHDLRDFPFTDNTSKLSPYLAIGAISVTTLCKHVLQLYPEVVDEKDTGTSTWLSEIIWREFYRNLLFYYPNLIKGGCFVEKYNALVWPDTACHFELWRTARTGFPIVDAAMRQLNQTGWMHNRLRMVVASFLTKNLLVNWRLGESYFMQQLIDGDFAANNGGWQWSASTGCDAQPYFRVFNPVSQSKKFDPDGEFIRKYLPELKDVPSKHIHEPQTYLAAIGQSQLYWPPLVDLKLSRQQAIAFYGIDNEQSATA